jgi:dTMP kinase
MKTQFITFEGPDGSGKTTALKGLIKYLNRKHLELDYIFTREPGGSITAEAIRKVILNKRNFDMDSEVEAFLYAGARRQHLVSTI